MDFQRTTIHLKEHEVRLDMTSMIDLTFLLVFFFVLTSSFTSLNLEDLLLPVALSAEELKPVEEVPALIINIKKTADRTRAGAIIFNGEPVDSNQLAKALRLEAQADAARRGMEQPADLDLQKRLSLPALSRLEALVRADEGVLGRYLRDVFMACQKAGIYKVKLAALHDE